MSRWLRDRARPALERELRQQAQQQQGAGGSGAEVARRLLGLLSGHQLAPAAALATATGNVRLATLLAQASLLLAVPAWICILCCFPCGTCLGVLDG